MIYEVTYKDANGNPLLVATFNARGPADALWKLHTVTTLQPPLGTCDIEVRHAGEDASVRT